MHPETGYKCCKFGENRARDTSLRGVYIPHFDQISVKISVLGVLCPYRRTDGGEIWRGGGDLLPSSTPNFTPSVQRVARAGQKKPQNQPLSNLNTSALHFAQPCL